MDRKRQQRTRKCWLPSGPGQQRTLRSNNMRQQQVMNRILEDWVLTTHNAHELERTFGYGWQSAVSARNRKEQLERILKSNGFVYSVATWNKEGQRTLFWLFRQKPVKSLTRLMQSTLKRKKVTDSIESDCRWEL